MLSDAQGEQKEYRLGVGKAVSSSESAVANTESKESEVESDAPRYGFVSLGVEAVSIVLSSKDASLLGVSDSYFRKSVTPTS